MGNNIFLLYIIDAHHTVQFQFFIFFLFFLSEIIPVVWIGTTTMCGTLSHIETCMNFACAW